MKLENYLLIFPAFVLVLIFLFLQIFKFYIFRLDTVRIGHFCREITKLNRIKNIKKRKILLLYSTPICNHYLFQELRKKSGFFFLKKNKVVNFSYYLFSKIYGFYQKRHLFLKFGHNIKYSDSPIKKPNLESPEGKKLLKKLNLKITDKWICIYNRDQNYLQKHLGEKKDHHDYRNFDIDDYIKAIDLFTKNGFKVVRVGSHVEKRLEIDNPNYIDYSSLEVQNDVNDIFIISHCKFFISSGTGIHEIPQLFGIPFAIINQTPLDSFFVRKFYFPGIFKLYRDKNSGKILSFSDIFNQKLHRITSSKFLDEMKIQVINNSKEDILNLAEDILLYLKHGRKPIKSYIEKNENIKNIVKKINKSYFLNDIQNNFLSKLIL